MCDLSPFPFHSFSPIPITPFQVPPVFGSNMGPDSLNLRQVYQPVPGDQATDTTDLVLGQPVSKWQPGTTAEGH